ncbi:autotransporter assembly complex protein TamA [Blastomonas aquatica]|uniref:autotransporter assembly complex protein TamA n=1 Tax=Blastomonas aquatica TaxID=1510276 RepID=UPI001E4A1284|nr:BamA/TamA family outer membrane protein [Blastomonas aquatica]
MITAQGWIPSASALQAPGQTTPQTPPQTTPSRPQPGNAATEPIITDEEFDATIPTLDADPNAPLGTIEEWDAEQTRLEQNASPDRAITGDPLSAPMELDPELDAPLGPIGSFDVEPFDESQYTQAAEDDATRAVRYTYRIEGLTARPAPDASETPALSDVSDKARKAVDPDDIRARFRELSALDDGDGRAANGAMVSARMIEDQQLLADLLIGQCFFDATVNGAVEMPESGEGPMVVVLTASPGPCYRFDSITFTAPPVEPEDLITRSFVPAIGEPVDADRVLAAEANIAVALPQYGYPFAQVGQRDVLLDPATDSADYTLPVTPGARSSFGDIVTSGTSVFEADHIATLARFDKGDLYDSRLVDDLRKALVATGLYSVVAVKPEPTGEVAPDGTQYAALAVEQEAGPARTLAANAGYGTGQGIRAQGSWTHRNLFPPEGALIASIIAGTQEQGASGTFRRSNAGRRDRSVELSLSALRSDFAAFEAFTGRLAGRISYSSTPIWQKPITYSYGFELLGTNEQDFNFDLGRRDRRTYYVAALPGQITWDRSNDLLDPTTGFRLSAQVSPEASLGSGTQFYGRGLVEATGYFPFGDSIVLAGRARVGSIFGADRPDIAPSRRYYAGGGGSVRGFGFQELGPKDPDNRPIGGRSLVEGAAEVRYRFGNYGIVGFVDAGQVSISSTPGFDDLRFGAGLGGRFYTNFGPMRLDVATPIGRRPGESRVSIYISIGQAF